MTSDPNQSGTSQPAFFMPLVSIPQQPVGRLSTTAGLSATGFSQPAPPSNVPAVAPVTPKFAPGFAPLTTVPGQLLSHSEG